MNELPELTDVQIALLVKSALEYNACIIALAALIYKQDVKLSDRRHFVKQVKEAYEQYTDIVKQVIGEDDGKP